MTDAAEVKAHIKLRFKNRNDHTCVVTRSLQVTKKRTKLEYKALDAALSTLDRNGQRSSISMKCSEVDRVIPENLGVSGAMLENVIFVHQEDCNWPMQESSVLKKKFDDIFESTRYTKALEALVKTKKDFQSKAKDHKADLAELNGYMLTVQQNREELVQAEDSHNSCNEDLERIKVKLEDYERMLQRYQGVLDQSQRKAQELDKLRWQANEAERRVQEKSQSLESTLTESDDALRDILDNFEAAMKAKVRGKDELASSANAVRSKMAELRDRLAQLNTVTGQASLLHEQSRQAKQQQLDWMRSAGRKITGVASPPGEWSRRLCAEYEQALTKETQRGEQEWKDRVARERAEQTALERSVQQLRSSLQELEVKLRMLCEEDDRVLEEWESKRQEKSRLAVSAAALQRAQEDCDSCQQEHDEFMKEYENLTAQLRRKMKECSDRIHSLQDDLATGQATLQELGRYRTELSNLDASARLLDSERENLCADLASIFSMNSEILAGLTVPQTSKELESAVERVAQESSAVDQRVKRTREELLESKASLASKEALLAQLNAQRLALRPKEQAALNLLEEMQGHVTGLNQLRSGKILSGANLEPLPSDISPQTLVEAAKATEDEARELLMLAKSGKVFLKRLKRRQHEDPNKCPCCGQGLGEDAALKENLEARVRNLFSLGDEEQYGSIEEHQETLAGCEGIHEALQSLYTRYVSVQCVGQDCAQLEHEMRELTRDKHALDDQVALNEQRLSDMERLANQRGKVLRQLQDLEGKWRTIEGRVAEVQDKQRRHTQSHSMGEYSGLSYEELEQLQRERQEQKDQQQAMKEGLQNEEVQLTKRASTVKAKLADAMQALSAAKLDGKRVEEADSLIARLQAKHDELDGRRKQLQSDRNRVASQLEDILVQFNASREAVSGTESAFKAWAQQAQQDGDAFRKFTSQIEDLEQRYAALQVDQVDADMAATSEALSSGEKEIQSLSARIAAIETELASQDHVRRNIVANLDLRATREEVSRLQDELRAQERLAGDSFLQVQEAKAQLAKLSKEKESLATERDTLGGKLQVHAQRILSIQQMLNKAPYKGVEEKYRAKCIEFETTTIAVADLDNYYSAL